MSTMPPPRTVEVTPQTAIGVSLALLGVVLTLDNLGFVDAGAVMRFWPLIPMLVGAAYIVQGRELREWVLGTAWLLAGTAFLLRNLDVFRFRLADFLPLILVAIGLKVIFKRRGMARQRQWPGMPDGTHPPPVPGVSPHVGPMGDVTFGPRFDAGFEPGFGSGFGSGRPGGAPDAAPGAATGAATSNAGHQQVLRVFAMLSGADRRHRGGLAHVEVSAVMGGCDIDLRDAVPTSDPLVVQVFAMWGGIEIRVPPGWLVQNEAWPILGGIVDSTTPPTVPTHRVILRGNAFMGGVEMKN